MVILLKNGNYYVVILRFFYFRIQYTYLITKKLLFQKSTISKLQRLNKIKGGTAGPGEIPDTPDTPHCNTPHCNTPHCDTPFCNTKITRNSQCGCEL
ncbi:hypothetical protein GTQ40_13800 [Flavobacteriaceae bacterium R38]|nr:hypothetical protein [Flavobacteriaceae bacterium R38]